MKVGGLYEEIEDNNKYGSVSIGNLNACAVFNK